MISENSKEKINTTQLSNMLFSRSFKLKNKTQSLENNYKKTADKIWLSTIKKTKEYIKILNLYLKIQNCYETEIIEIINKLIDLFIGEKTFLQETRRKK